jgi:hypothetical protein
MHSSEDETKEIKTGRYELFDEEGFQSQPVFLYAPNKKRLADNLGGWTVNWQEATMLLAKDKRLNLTDHRVLLVLQAKLDFDNWIRLSLSQIGQEIEVAKPNVSTSMKKLVEMGVVILGPSVKQVKTYRLNPSVAWKGKMFQGAKERRASLKVITGGKDITPDPNQLPLL